MAASVVFAIQVLRNVRRVAWTLRHRRRPMKDYVELTKPPSPGSS